MIKYLCLFVHLLCLSSVWAYDIAEIIQEADKRRLYDDRYWEILLQYEDGVSGYRSLVDDPSFFLSENGKYSKKDEMAATLKAILTYDYDDPNEHAQCRFPARTAWLKEQLGDMIPDSEFTKISCPMYETVYARVMPYRATLVFPYYNLTGPASMFGHTLLRIEPEVSTSILGYAITYAADSEGSGAIDYILKGSMGGFMGRYNILPYYEKLNEYSAIEYRDVWEYELNLTPEEVERMFKHIWEISLVYSDYYFFDENCAYNLLFLLESARPEIDITSGYITVAPIDTVRSIIDAGIVSDIKFRPSNIKKMLAMSDMLSKSSLKISREIAAGKYNPKDLESEDIPVAEKMAILDLASEIVRGDYQKATPSQMRQYQKLSISIARARAFYPGRNEYNVDVPTGTPDIGHFNSRFTLKGGYLKDDFYFGFGIRPAFHDMIDNTIGYLDGDLSVFDINLRYYTNGKFNISDVSIIRVTSLSPFNKLLTKPSWTLDVGVADRSINPDRTNITTYLNLGFGASGEVFKNETKIWLMADFEVAGSSNYTGSGVAVGYGGLFGIHIPINKFSKIITRGNYLWYTDSGHHQEGNILLQVALYPTINSSVVAEGKWSKRSDDYESEFGISYSMFF